MTTCIDTRGALNARSIARITCSGTSLLHKTLVRRAGQIVNQGLVTLGIVVAGVSLLLLLQPPLRVELERNAVEWLQQRQGMSAPTEDSPTTLVADNPSILDPRQLPTEQQRVAQWLARKYRVASEPLAALVSEAHVVGQQLRLDPMLILAVIAAESRFNPYAASPWGAQGLMQVHTRMHADKFEDFGGTHAAFDPLSNLRVGAVILRDAIRSAGSVPGGLRLYVGAVSVDARDYIVKVMSEQERLKRVAAGQQVGFLAPMPLPAELVAEARTGDTVGDPPPALMEADPHARPSHSAAEAKSS